ncbi:hypothetical protein [Methylobacterium soli]|uniref:Uncharacterized protein n=1 Tax=Methylobacterium soli TaxID=553447 RepID=A0A6L3T684_9HYPH|nr:hypothetical protein [Methylobacterium soli]KAB1080891.1 hypothetical protein F6X53_04165 [Methylobacterium soli]
MKRRSARPFTVEVTHTRTSRASLTDATARSREGQNLWQGLPLIADDKPAEVQRMQPAPIARSEPVQPEAPARRVLPSLVPTFSMPIEPEAPEVPEVPAEERLPRVRRLKQLTKREQKPKTKVIAAQPSRAASATQPRVKPASVFTPAETSAVVARPASVLAGTGRRAEQALTLRRGERWKRRLPRALW